MFFDQKSINQTLAEKRRKCNVFLPVGKQHRMLSAIYALLA
jgi:hypothetical protein